MKEKTDKHWVKMDDDEEDDWMDGYRFHRSEVHMHQLAKKKRASGIINHVSC